jgi:uncharacterized cupin superfamily protein
MIPQLVSLPAVEVLHAPLSGGTPRMNPTRGEPVEAFMPLFESDGVASGIWECTPGRFPVSRGASHSIMYILSGSGKIVSSDGSEQAIAAGDVYVEPAHWTGEWEIAETVRKVYVIRSL